MAQIVLLFQAKWYPFGRRSSLVLFGCEVDSSLTHLFMINVALYVLSRQGNFHVEIPFRQLLPGIALNLVCVLCCPATPGSVLL